MFNPWSGEEDLTCLVTKKKKKIFFLIKKKNKKTGNKWRVDGNGQDRKKGTRPDDERSSRGETEEGREECVLVIHVFH